MAVAQEEPGRRIVWIDDDLAEKAGCPAPSEEGAGATGWNGQRAPTLRQ
ncbi:MAG: hypothetical protein JWO67_4311 [Streptosporangiaceae bacterium]|nr:hypothetical protein [Streptosporangiaceae bacterium]